MRAFLMAIALFLVPGPSRAQTIDPLQLPTQEYIGIVCNNETAARYLGSYYFIPQQETGYYPFASFLFTAMRANTCFPLAPFEVDSSVMVTELDQWRSADYRLVLVRFTRINNAGELVMYYGYFMRKGWDS